MSFWFITKGQKFYQTRHFHLIIVQSSIKKTIPEKSNDRTFKETKIFHWATVPIVQENQNASKRSDSVTLFSLSIP